MSDLLELLFQLIIAVLELLVKSIIFAFKILMTVCSKKQRDRLKKEWNENKKNKTFIVTALMLIAFTTYVIISFLFK